MNQYIDYYEKYIGIKYDATGVWGYSYRVGHDPVASIGALFVPNPDIFVSGYGYKLCHKKYDYDMTLAQGVRRVFVDDGDNDIGYYEYDNTGKFIIVGGNKTLVVKTFIDEWKIYDDQKLVAVISRIDEENIVRFEEDGFDMETRFNVSMIDCLSEVFRLMIFAIPVLGF